MGPPATRILTFMGPRSRVSRLSFSFDKHEVRVRSTLRYLRNVICVILLCFATIFCLAQIPGSSGNPGTMHSLPTVSHAVKHACCIASKASTSAAATTSTSDLLLLLLLLLLLSPICSA